VTPFDAAVLTDYQPLFTWLYSGQTANTAYCLSLFELGDQQTAEQAVLANQPSYKACDISAPLLQYPVDAQKLDNCKTYAWKVDVMESSAFLMGSEVWEFRTPCDSATQIKPDPQIYVALNSDLTGSVYETEKWMCFAIDQPYQTIDDFQISIQRFDGVLMDNEPVIDVLRNQIGNFNGKNMYNLDLTTTGIQKGSYLLTLRNQKEVFYLKFRFF